MDEKWKGRIRVGIYGNQLVMSAIGANLEERAEFEVQRIEGGFPGIGARLEADPPHVILFDLTATQPDFAVSLIHDHPKILAIGVDLINNKMLVLSGKTSRLVTDEDLVRAIQSGVFP